MEVIDKKIVWEGSFLRTVLLTYRDHEGKLRNWEAVERVNCSGITVIVPVTVDREFLLIRQFRPVMGRYVLEFPAGLNNPGEAPETAGQRELIEETGYTSDRLIYLTEGPVSSGMSTELLCVYLAPEARPATAGQLKDNPPDESEDIELIKTPVSKVYEALDLYKKQGDLIDLKLYGLIEMAVRRLDLK